ncbi:MAG: beta-propeller fold lactonase family protein [Acidobacteriaceae bacterium]
MGFRTLSSGRWLAVGCAALLALTGCGQFFPPLSSTSGGGSGTTSSGDYLYVGNLGTNPLSLGAFSVGTSSLSALSGSPWTVELEPNALAVTPNDSYLYVGSAAGGIYVYTLSNGVPTIANNGAPVATGVAPSVLRVDPTGNYLLGADALVGNVYVFQIGSGGALTAISSSLVTLNASLPANDLEITPGGGLVFVSCGTAGIYALSFNSSNGALVQVRNPLIPKQSSDAIYGMAVTPSGSFLLAAETGIGAVRIFTIGSSGSLTEVTGSPVATGTGPFDVLVDSTGSYVYVTNRTSGTISAFLLTTTGALTPIAGSPFATGTLPELMVEDKTDAYVAVICAGGGPDLQLFKFDATTPGALDSVASVATGTDPTQVSALAATH